MDHIEIVAIVVAVIVPAANYAVAVVNYARSADPDRVNPQSMKVEMSTKLLPDLWPLDCR